MRKLFTISALALLITLLMACSSDDNNDQATNDNEPENEELNNEENTEEEPAEENEDIDEENDGNATNSEDNEETDEETNDEGMDDADKEAVLERYDEDLGLGDTTEWERSDGLSTDEIKFTVNSFKTVDELNGEKPENDLFLLVNVTIENQLSDQAYSAGFIRSHLDDDERDSYQNEREELALEFEEKDNGVSTGDVVYDVNKSDYYRIHFFDDYYLIFMDDQSE